MRPDGMQARMVELVTAALEEAGLSQAEFSRLTGATPKHVNLFVRGKAGVSLPMLDYWAHVLGKRWEISLVEVPK